MSCSFCGEETVYGDHRYGYECQRALSNRIDALYDRIREQDREIKELERLLRVSQEAEAKDAVRPTMESVLLEEATIAGRR